jgi:plasmid stabilization system protein ParE
VHGNCLIFYRTSAEMVEIVHIMHGAMDYEDILFPK